MDGRETARRFSTDRSRGSREKSRALYRIAAKAPGPTYTSFSDTIENVRTALLERVFYHESGGVFSSPVTPTLASVQELLSAFRRQLYFRRQHLAPVDLLEFASKYYRGQRLRRYSAATQRILNGGLQHKHSYLSTFLKHEKIPVASKRAVPRVIQPRKPEYNVALGVYIRPLEHVLYSDIARVFGRPTVMKGYNASQIGGFIHDAWLSYDDPVAFGLDASRFDQHVNKSLLVWEHLVYDMYYPGCAPLRTLLSWQLRNQGRCESSDGVCRYVVEGGRCSGDMNTALGNCLIMCAAVYSLLAKCGMAQKHKTRVSLFNNGDDCILIGERSHISIIRPLVAEHFAKLGLVMKIEDTVEVIEEISFCQTQPVFDGSSWRMCRDPRVCLSKDLYLLDRDLALHKQAAQLYAIGKCGLSLTGGLPLCQDFYRMLTRSGSPVGAIDHNILESGFFRLAEGMNEEYRLVTDAARISFARAFKIVPDLQLALEEEYRECTIRTGPFTYGAPSVTTL